MDDLRPYEDCRLCPRECGVNRLEGQRGYCGEGVLPRVAYVGAHYGEEPPISGTRGSGTVFFSGCSLRCSYCQNHQISHGGLGEGMETAALIERVFEMIEGTRVHNVNLVTPDHFFPHAFLLVRSLRERGCDLPVLYNLSGYQSRRLLEQAEEWADIYLPDFKYSDPRLSSRLSGCPDYPRRALDAISEMVRQKGLLDSTASERLLARKGVLVRHLILPGQIQNSLDVLTTLFLEFGPGVPLSLMSQYTPLLRQYDPELNRPINREEFDRVYEHALELGFENLFVQFPEEPAGAGTGESPFVPDFQRARPFSGEASKD
jgi:putative pyruvate formate lyase activating enzyme